MTTEAQTQETSTFTAVINKIVDFLKTDEKTVVTKVMKRAKKLWGRKISQGEKQILAIRAEYVEKIEDAQESLSDAKTAYDESFMQIDITLKGNDQIDAFIEDSFQKSIKASMDKVQSLEDEIKDLKAAELIEIKEVKDAVKLYLTILAKIS